MRTYHRWLGTVFGIFLLWISATGVASQVAALVANGGFEKEEAKPAAPKTAGNFLIPAAQAHEGEEEAVKPAPAFKCPDTMTCRPKAPPTGARAWVGYLHHLHSGEEFGPAGVIVSTMSGLALFFFAFSGLYMYIQMYRRRARRHSHPRRLFW